jgi:hypothetical protein|nr:MAG: hypothetical protein DIU57_05685 [Pseudomonadota bacterium]
MNKDVKSRLEQAIREADERSQITFRQIHAVEPEVANAFAPVAEAARELEDYMRSIQGIEFTISPASVSIRLGDLELWVTYDPRSKKFVGEESAHSWYDSVRYADRYEWSSAEECTDALIRFCAQYYRMARAINQAASRG